MSVVCGTNQPVTFESNRIGIVRFEFDSNSIRISKLRRSLLISHESKQWRSQDIYDWRCWCLDCQCWCTLMPRLHLIHVARIHQVVPTCVHFYRLSPSTCILYRRQNCRHGYMYPLVSASRTLLRTCIRRHRRTQVARPGYLCPATYYLVGVNAAKISTVCILLLFSYLKLA